MAGSGRLAFLATISLQSLLPAVRGQVDNSTAEPTMSSFDNSTAEPTTSSPPGRLSSTELAVAIAVPVVFVALLLIGLLVFMGFRVREKRQTEGTYRPSNEEQVGARVVTNANLKLPPEERLI